MEDLKGQAEATMAGRRRIQATLTSHDNGGFTSLSKIKDQGEWVDGEFSFRTNAAVKVLGLTISGADLAIWRDNGDGTEFTISAPAMEVHERSRDIYFALAMNPGGRITIATEFYSEDAYIGGQIRLAMEKY